MLHRFWRNIGRKFKKKVIQKFHINVYLVYKEDVLRQEYASIDIHRNFIIFTFLRLLRNGASQEFSGIFEYILHKNRG